MEELRKARDPLSAVIGMQSAAAIPRGPLNGSDRKSAASLPSWTVGSFLLRRRPRRATKTAQSRGPAMLGHMEDQNTSICTLTEANFDILFSHRVMCSKVLGNQSWVNTWRSGLQGGPEICCCTHQCNEATTGWGRGDIGGSQ